MAMQFTDFSKAPILSDPWTSAFEDFLKGYKMGGEPRRMKAAEEEQARKAQLSKLEVEHKPKEYELSDEAKTLANAIQKKANEHYEDKLQMDKDYKQSIINKNNRVGSGGTITPSGNVRNIAYLKQLKNDPNADPDYVAQVEEQIKADRAAKEIQNQHTQKLTETQGQRALSNIGKTLSEYNDAKAGFVPGTGRTQKMDSAQQEEYKKRYAAKLIKDGSNSELINSAVRSTLIDTAIDKINVDDLVRFSGLEGEIEKLKRQNLPVTPEMQDEYTRYKQELIKVDLLAKQVRQFGKDSISPSNLKKLESLTNPSSWREKPEVAKAQFVTLADLLKTEGKRLRDSVSDINAVLNENGMPSLTNVQQTAPEIPSWVTSKEKFQSWLQSLPPEQQMALKMKHTGG